MSGLATLAVAPDLDEAALLETLRDRVRRGDAWFTTDEQRLPPRPLSRVPTPEHLRLEGGVLQYLHGAARATVDGEEPCWFGDWCWILDEEEALRLRARQEEKALALQRERERAEEDRLRAIEEERLRWRSLSLASRILEINGRRQTRTLALETVERAARQIASEPIGTARLLLPGGLVWANAYRKKAYRAPVATVALLVRVPRAVAAEVALGSGRGSTPRGWEPILDDPDRALAWARTQGPARLSLVSLNRGVQP